jgi:hypothetical protein
LKPHVLNHLQVKRRVPPCGGQVIARHEGVCSGDDAEGQQLAKVLSFPPQSFMSLSARINLKRASVIKILWCKAGAG